MATVIEAHSLREFGLASVDHRRTDHLYDALRMAPVLRGDRLMAVILHSSRGTKHASGSITLFAAKNGISRSMGYIGICLDNAIAESLSATSYTEFYFRRVWPTRVRAIQGIADRGPLQSLPAFLDRACHAEDFEMQCSSQAAEIQLAV